MSKPLSLDFTDVDTRDALPPGEYIVKVKKIEEREGDKAPYLNWEFEVDLGQFKGRKLWNTTSLAPQSLWVLKKQLSALGVSANGKMALNLDALVGLKCGVKLEQKEYQGKTRAKVIDVFPLETNVAEEGGDEDEPEE